MKQPDIKRFSISGASADSGYIIKKQAHEEKRLRMGMMKSGYSQVLDIPPILDIEYSSEKETFFYTITVYGVECDSPRKYEGWLTGRWIPSTETAKSRKS